jgi:hypothetical protein
MRHLFFIPFIFILHFFSYSQKINSNDFKKIRISEDSLKKKASIILDGINISDRSKADSFFIKIFVRALKNKNSFYYPFDSLERISKLYPEDSSFRIFTWHLVIDDNNTVQHGVIQMKSEDGSLNLFPLFDRSDLIEKIEDTVADNYAWIGAIYYKIIQTSFENQKFYTLLGYDENNIRSNRKFIDVLHFENGKPIFGGNYFDIPDTIIPVAPLRYVMEYKKHTGPRLAFDEDMQIIIMEHLISETNEPLKKYTYIGDGDYEGFKWENGKWKYILKVFNQVTPEDQAPVPDPMRDEKGTILDEKLKGRNEEDKKN